MIQRCLTILSALALLLVVGCGVRSASVQDLVEIAASHNWPDPARFEDAIAAFEREQAPPAGAIVAVGSSSIRGWHRTISEDLAPLTIVPRGFGGSNMFDALHFVDRAVLVHEPRAVLLYEGDNDMTMDLPVEGFLDAFRAFVARVHEADPAIRIHVIAIKLSPSRERFWDRMREANELLRLECERDPRLFYIDIVTPMMDESGRTREDLFIGDRLHLNRAGYEIWRDAVREVLIPVEGPFEAMLTARAGG